MNFIGELAWLATSSFFAMTALIFTSTGRMGDALVEPVQGVSSSLLAVQHGEIGVASTVTSFKKLYIFLYIPQNLINP